jgi:catechol 2,3-dioxygenase-like lactoylglutathione lyase family enzyme
MSSPDCVITGLRSVALGVENFDEALDFYAGLWGLVTVAQTAEAAWLASPTDPAAFLLRLRKVEAKRLDLIGLTAGTRANVDALAARLAAADVRIDRHPADLDSPGGGYGFRFFDCDGRLIEVAADVAPRAIGNGNIGGAIKGAPVNLSHVVLNTLDVSATRAFYQDMLGFQLSDWLEDRMCFLRCASPKHHIIAIAQGPHVSLNHVAYDVGTIDAQMRATGRLKRAERKLIWGPGRHFIGNNTFSYFIDPAGNVCEFTSELEEITDPDWQPRKVGMSPEFQDQWGTGGLVTDGMIPAQFNAPDRGLWQTSPL